MSDTFKVTFRNMLNKKNCTVEYFSYTTVVNNTFGQQIYIANQWFVIASYFVDFCSEMLSYQSLFYKICERIGLNHKGMKEYATRLKEAPTMEDKSSFIQLWKCLMMITLMYMMTNIRLPHIFGNL